MTFKLTMKGTGATVKRTFTLPKIGDVAAVPLESNFHVDIDLGGIKKGTETYKKLLKQFEIAYRLDLNHSVKKLESSLLKSWTAGAKGAGKAKTEAQANKIGTTLQKNLLETWNAFPGKSGKPYAEQVIDTVLKQMRGDFDTKGVKPKIKLGDEALKSDRVSILTSILGGSALLAGGVPSGGLAWIAAGLGAVKVLLDGAEAYLSMSDKRSREGKKNIAQISQGLDDANSALSGLKPSLSQLAISREKFSAEMALAARALTKAREKLADLEKKAGNEAGPDEKKMLAKFRGEVDLLFFKARAFEESVGDIRKLEKAVKDANKAVAEACSLVKAEDDNRANNDGALQTLWKDKSTLLSSYKSVFSAASKLT